MSIPIIVLAGLAWLGLLFLVALAGERLVLRSQRAWPVVYSLSLAVYCTAWTFYGTTTQAARSGWPIPPTFIGTIVLFVFGIGVLERLVRLSKQHNATSIADLIASRFGKSRALAATVTLVALLGMVPYIALQLNAVVLSFAALTAGGVGAGELDEWRELALWVALAMAAFAMLFGTRRASAVEHNRGLVLAMGFESLLKLTAMLVLGAYVVLVLFEGPAELAAASERPAFRDTDTFITLALLGGLAMFTLPHQFHIGVVECRDASHLRTARWLFPLFLLLISVPIWPLALAGNALLAGEGVPADLYVLMLPLGEGQGGLALLAFLGGLSAATGMVILASLTLSIMVGNHWLTPLMLRGRDAGLSLPVGVRAQRRAGIVLVLLLAYGYSRSLGLSEALADIGAISFSGLAQLTPAVLLAIWRPGLPARAIIGGLLAGIVVWSYVLFMPMFWPQLAGGEHWLSANALLGLTMLSPLSRAVLLSLAINLLVVGLMSYRRTGGEDASPEEAPERQTLRDLAQRFLPEARCQSLFASQRQGRALAEAVELELAAVVGSGSARLLLKAAQRRTSAPLETVADMVGQASARARFSQEVLLGALENMSQGICVVDRELKLVAWNQPYLSLFDYPPEIIRVGQPVADLLRHNARAGLMGEGNIEVLIQRRLEHKRAGHRHRIERRWPDGRIIEIRGNPMPGGGFVATFADVTAFRQAESELKRINETLEQRVQARTAEFESAKLEAERASEAKSRFLAAVSHDLVQPMNAARLLTHSLAQRVTDPLQAQSVTQIDGALGATESLLGSLLDISRLDADGVEPRRRPFALNELFVQLAGEFSLLAAERGLQLRWVSTRVWVDSDPSLVRRILQNFLANAVRYTDNGKVLLGCRRLKGRVLVGVWDTGPGIEIAQQGVIFEEFRRLGKDREAPGLGLGLAIAERMARLLEHPLRMQSQPGRGTCFAIEMRRCAARTVSKAAQGPQRRALAGRVLVVDNDASMLGSLQRLLADWGMQVDQASHLTEALDHANLQPPDLLLLDYHLDNDHTGVEVLGALRRIGIRAPAVLISADHAAEVRRAATEAGCELLHKPIRPLALRSLLQRVLLGK